MTIMKLDLQPDNVARFNPGNALRAVPSGADAAAPRAGDLQSATFLVSRGALDYITMADRAYIAHDLPKPVIRDIFGSAFCPVAEPRIDWEGIAIGAFLVGYLIFISAVLLKVAAFGSTVIG